MTKISGILPTSARIEALNIKGERPVRSGAPSIGEPTVMPAQRAKLFPTETAGGLSDELLERPFKLTGPKSDTLDVDLLANRFFMKRQLDGVDTPVSDPGLIEGEVASTPSPRLSIRV